MSKSKKQLKRKIELLKLLLKEAHWINVELGKCNGQLDEENQQLFEKDEETRNLHVTTWVDDELPEAIQLNSFKIHDQWDSERNQYGIENTLMEHAEAAYTALRNNEDLAPAETVAVLRNTYIQALAALSEHRYRISRIQ